MSTITITTDTLADRLRPQVREIAEGIASRTRQRAKDHEYRGSVEVIDHGDGCRVLTHNPFAALDEYGSVNNAASGAMRSAALDAGGNYEINPKP